MLATSSLSQFQCKTRCCSNSEVTPISMDSNIQPSLEKHLFLSLHLQKWCNEQSLTSTLEQHYELSKKPRYKELKALRAGCWKSCWSWSHLQNMLAFHRSLHSLNSRAHILTPDLKSIPTVPWTSVSNPKGRLSHLCVTKVSPFDLFCLCEANPCSLAAQVYIIHRWFPGAMHSWAPAGAAQFLSVQAVRSKLTHWSLAGERVFWSRTLTPLRTSGLEKTVKPANSSLLQQSSGDGAIVLQPQEKSSTVCWLLPILASEHLILAIKQSDCRPVQSGLSCFEPNKAILSPARRTCLHWKIEHHKNKVHEHPWAQNSVTNLGTSVGARNRELKRGRTAKWKKECHLDAAATAATKGPRTATWCTLTWSALQCFAMKPNGHTLPPCTADIPWSRIRRGASRAHVQIPTWEDLAGCSLNQDWKTAWHTEYRHLWAQSWWSAAFSCITQTHKHACWHCYLRHVSPTKYACCPFLGWAWPFSWSGSSLSAWLLCCSWSQQTVPKIYDLRNLRSLQCQEKGRHIRTVASSHALASQVHGCQAKSIAQADTERNDTFQDINRRHSYFAHLVACSVFGCLASWIFQLRHPSRPSGVPHYEGTWRKQCNIAHVSPN